MALVMQVFSFLMSVVILDMGITTCQLNMHNLSTQIAHVTPYKVHMSFPTKCTCHPLQSACVNPYKVLHVMFLTTLGQNIEMPVVMKCKGLLHTSHCSPQCHMSR